MSNYTKPGYTLPEPDHAAPWRRLLQRRCPSRIDGPYGRCGCELVRGHDGDHRASRGMHDVAWSERQMSVEQPSRRIAPLDVAAHIHGYVTSSDLGPDEVRVRPRSPEDVPPPDDNERCDWGCVITTPRDRARCDRLATHKVTVDAQEAGEADVRVCEAHAVTIRTGGR